MCVVVVVVVICYAAHAEVVMYVSQQCVAEPCDAHGAEVVISLQRPDMWRSVRWVGLSNQLLLPSCVCK